MAGHARSSRVRWGTGTVFGAVTGTDLRRPGVRRGWAVITPFTLAAIIASLAGKRAADRLPPTPRPRAASRRSSSSWPRSSAYTLAG
jgi:hypothetical protein